MGKKHLIEITEKRNKKLQKIKKDLGLDNIKQVIDYFIDKYKLKNNKNG